MQAIEVENERQQNLNNMKLQFFANISHELRYPCHFHQSRLKSFCGPSRIPKIPDMVKKCRLSAEPLTNCWISRKLDAKAETLKCKHDNILIILSEIFHSSIR